MIELSVSKGLFPFISSPDNPRANEMRSLRLAKFRQKYDCFVLESPKVLLEALQANATIRDCFLEESLHSKSEGKRLWQTLLEQGVRPAWASEKVMRSLTTLETPPLAVAAVKRTASSLEDLLAASPELIVVGEDIQDPGNVGTIIRTSSAAGFPAVVLCGASADFYSPKVVRAACGAILHCLLVRHASTIDAVEKLKRGGYRIIASVARGGVDYLQASLTKPTALLFGNEGRGLEKATLSLADAIIHIPMSPLIESLNVSSCCAILLYEALRQRSVARGLSPRRLLGNSPPRATRGKQRARTTQPPANSEAEMA